MSKISYDNMDDGVDEKNQRHIKDRFWETFKKAAKFMPFIDDLVAAYYCAMDPQTPTRTRVILLSALAYFVMPFDTVPDFLMALGFSDDAAVLMAAITAVRNHITPAHYKLAREALRDESYEN